jgi:hypothetical protein
VTTWRPGDPLPNDELWTLPMAAQYLKRHPEVVRRSDVPRIPGRPLTFRPEEVKEYARKRSTAYVPAVSRST